MTRTRKIVISSAAALVTLAAIVALAIVLILPSSWLRERVRMRLIAAIEDATGAKVDIGAFDWDWKTLHVDAKRVVLHGTEPAGVDPLLRAEDVHVWLRVVSFLERDVDVNGIQIDRPQVNVLVDKDGHTNIPTPKAASNLTDALQQILNLAAKEVRIRDGVIHVGDEKIRLDLTARDLAAKFDYDRRGPSYSGELHASSIDWKAPQVFARASLSSMDVALKSRIVIRPNQLRIEQATISSGRSHAEISGDVVNLLKPEANLTVQAVGDVPELRRVLGISEPNAGSFEFTGKATYTAESGVRAQGRLTGRRIAFRQGSVDLKDVTLTSAIRADARVLDLRDVVVRAAGGVLKGNAVVRDWHTFTWSGRAEDFSLATAMDFIDKTPSPYSATIAGPFEVSGTFPLQARNMAAKGTFDVTAGSGRIPVSGRIDAGYEGRTSIVAIGNSQLKTPASALTISGTPGQNLRVSLQSTDLNDLLPAIAMINSDAPAHLPPGTKSGILTFDGDVAGSASNPQISGKVSVQNAELQGTALDDLHATLRASRDSLQIQSLAVGQQQLRLEGLLSASLENWRLTPASTLSGHLAVTGARLGRLMGQVGVNDTRNVDGAASGDLQISGTYGSPNASGAVNVTNLVIRGERFDSLVADINYSGNRLTLNNAEAKYGPARVLFSANYEHALRNWETGRLTFDMTSRGVTLQQLGRIRTIPAGLDGQLNVQAMGTAKIDNLHFLPDKLEGRATIQGLSLDNRAIGDLVANATTTSNSLNVRLTGNIRRAKLSGDVVVAMSGDYVARGELSLEPTRISTVRDLVSTAAGATEPFPVGGVIAANATFDGPLRRPELLHATVQIPTLQIAPAGQNPAVRQSQDLTLINSGPIVLELAEKTLTIRNAKLSGVDTSIEASGKINLADERTPWNVRLKGNLNLAVLRDLDPRLKSSGISAMDATVRGSLMKPQLNGGLELKNASFYMVDVPNGLDQVNGRIIFDQNRATIVDHLTAETGGGRVTLSGFVGIGFGEMTYRLLVRTQDVRVRYPEGVSTTASSQFSFTGTTTHSMLTGVVTVQRVGLNPKLDFGGLLASTSSPLASPTAPSEFLRGMLLDLRIESTPNLQFEASITNNLQADVNLRVRGTGAKPSVTGRININQGEITFFGNKYIINRGDVSFINPAKIEPVLNFDLETRVRGIVVDIGLGGPLSKLNISYRSDPPLQANEIVALLAVGRDPGTYSTLAAAQAASERSAVLPSGTNALLGQAMNGRLQKFFGVSKLKIDPMQLGANKVPQARVTFEQQLSNNITLTYSTAISYVNEQLVRVEYAIDKHYSIVALREENGVFGIDVIYKKSFK